MAAADLRFLVAEDQEAQRIILVQILRNLGGKQILEAQDGAEALKHFANSSGPIDVVFVDLSMPGMDGLELIRHLAKRKFSGSLILITGLDRSLLTSAATMVSAYGIPLLGTLEKPATQNSIKALVELHGTSGANSEVANPVRPIFSKREISEGLKRDEFEPFFQQKVEVTTGKVVGFEALARWNHPEFGIVGPDSFVETMEKGSLIDQLTLSFLEKICRLCTRCFASQVRPTVALNLSLHSLKDSGFAQTVIGLVQKEGLNPTQFVLEVTETAAMTNVAVALENLARLRMTGFGLSIDDFGTGYSSIQQLTRIAFTELKIDRSFVTNAANNEWRKAILQSSIEMARRLRIKVVAEGVESREELALLRKLQCDYAQGYYLGHPMNAQSLLKSMRSGKQHLVSVQPANRRGMH